MAARMWVRGFAPICLVVAALSAGCDNYSHPSAPTPAQPNTDGQDAPPPSASLALTSLSPDTGSTDGGAQVQLSGSNFEPGARVTFDGVTAPLIYGSSQFMIAHPPAHAAGSVDVVVTNPDGSTAQRVFSYASPGSFDFNGDWDAVVSGDEIVFRFTIRDNALASVTCRTPRRSRSRRRRL